MVFTFQPPFFAGLSGYRAEMGSAFLCAALGIAPTVRHADYLASWLEVLRDDNRAIFRAASAATKAADWILARHAEASERREAA
jgi:antirestriction protein ArdC